MQTALDKKKGGTESETQWVRQSGTEKKGGRFTFTKMVVNLRQAKHIHVFAIKEGEFNSMLWKFKSH